MTARQHLLDRASLRNPDDGVENQCTPVGSDRPRHRRAIRDEIDGIHAGAALLDLRAPGAERQREVLRRRPRRPPGREVGDPGPPPDACYGWLVGGACRSATGPGTGPASRVPVGAATSADRDPKHARVPAAPPWPPVPPVPPVPERGPRRPLPGLDGLP